VRVSSADSASACASARGVAQRARCASLGPLVLFFCITPAISWHAPGRRLWALHSLPCSLRRALTTLMPASPVPAQPGAQPLNASPAAPHVHARRPRGPLPRCWRACPPQAQGKLCRFPAALRT
jgi:hypothetical protein